MGKIEPRTIENKAEIDWRAESYSPVKIRLVDAIAMLNEKLHDIPEGLRDAAIFAVEIEGCYEDSAYATFGVEWSRPESDAELAERQRQHEQASQRAKEAAERRKIKKQERERETFERLKAKYEPTE